MLRLLGGSLGIGLKGSKLGRLGPVKCIIPSLKEPRAESLNHAYRLVSEAFEPERISHAGNVFKKVVYVDLDGNCRSLEDLRHYHAVRFLNEHLAQGSAGSE